MMISVSPKPTRWWSGHSWRHDRGVRCRWRWDCFTGCQAALARVLSGGWHWRGCGRGPASVRPAPLARPRMRKIGKPDRTVAHAKGHKGIAFGAMHGRRLGLVSHQHDPAQGLPSDWQNPVPLSFCHSANLLYLATVPTQVAMNHRAAGNRCSLKSGSSPLVDRQGQGAICTLMTPVLATARSMAAGRSDKG